MHRSPNYRSLILDPSSRGHIAAAIVQIDCGVVGLGNDLEGPRSKSGLLTKPESREAQSRRQRERQESLSIGMAARGRIHVGLAWTVLVLITVLAMSLASWMSLALRRAHIRVAVPRGPSRRLPSASSLISGVVSIHIFPRLLLERSRQVRLAKIPPSILQSQGSCWAKHRNGNVQRCLSLASCSVLLRPDSEIWLSLHTWPRAPP